MAEWLVAHSGQSPWDEKLVVDCLIEMSTENYAVAKAVWALLPRSDSATSSVKARALRPSTLEAAIKAQFWRACDEFRSPAVVSSEKDTFGLRRIMELTEFLACMEEFKAGRYPQELKAMEAHYKSLVEAGVTATLENGKVTEEQLKYAEMSLRYAFGVRNAKAKPATPGGR